MRNQTNYDNRLKRTAHPTLMTAAKPTFCQTTKLNNDLPLANVNHFDTNCVELLGGNHLALDNVMLSMRLPSRRSTLQLRFTTRN